MKTHKAHKTQTSTFSTKFEKFHEGCFDPEAFFAAAVMLSFVQENQDTTTNEELLQTCDPKLLLDLCKHLEAGARRLAWVAGVLHTRTVAKAMEAQTH
ncbi:hypothetical protein [Ferrovum myxofaciens]|uniref:Uncharacterized protein n=1 Tax=Ferrovum myxofaciens TaxID=416213 RepID=A0A9E6MYU6_9PROT|nr:hypothetical protein [Ferrovum myxofaciens]QKE37570.1 MAG: hypothetical protein HO273_01470 [Ferrovum myxofaciens]QWY75224.1 MAG: hypothetical protein JVY19_01900 [Ferrovum myxofaciens]QWY77958.1 MAG: hypothetical protein JZL65_02400 [Ferrovum myxofaciens]